MAPGEPGELGDQLSVEPRREIGFDPVLHCREPQLLERRRFARGERHVEPGERRAVPEGVGVTQEPRARPRLLGCAGLGQQGAESFEVELAGLHPDRIAGAGGRDAIDEDPPQA